MSALDRLPRQSFALPRVSRGPTEPACLARPHIGVKPDVPESWSCRDRTGIDQPMKAAGVVTRRDWERHAIRGLLDVLSVGETVRLLGHPEDDPTSPLTVDALVDRDGQVWAIEHMRLALDDRLPPAVAEVDQQLKDFVGELSASLNVRIGVAVQPPAGNTKARRRYFANLRSIIEVAAANHEDVVLEDGTQVLVDPGGAGSRVSTWMQDTADLTQLVRRTSGPVLARKLEEQLSPASAEVDRIALLLDQQHPPDTRQWPNWLAQRPGTILDGLGDSLATYPGLIDEIWLRDTSETYKRLAP